MLETSIRLHYQAYLLDPLLKLSFIKKLSPNFITLLACFTGLAVLPMMWLGKFALATLFLIMSGYFDTLDGRLARLTERTSDHGTVYDIISDRIVESAAVIGLFSIDPQHRGGLALLMLSSILVCVTSFLLVGVFSENDSEKSFHYSPGIMERAEAFIFFIAMMWLPVYFNTLAIVFSSLVLLTAYLRIRQFNKFRHHT